MVQEQTPGDIKIRLAKPYLGDRQVLIALIEELLDSGFFVQGKNVAHFERQVAEYLGVKHAIAVSSGTAALHLSLIALGIRDGDEVIVPAYTFPATANVVELVGARPVLVDVDLETYNVLVEQIEGAISPRTKAIIPVHLFGNPADMDPIIGIAREHNLVVIEDAAGALGSEYKGRKCGTIGILGCFSFHPRKVITTGEGGMVVTDADALAGQIRILRNHGMQTTGSQHEFVAAGFNYRMNELEAALGIVQMREIDKIIAERQRLVELYVGLLKDNPGVVFQKILPDCLSVWQAFVIRLVVNDVDSVLEHLREAGIQVNIGTYALHLLEYYKRKYQYKTLDYTNATDLYFTAMALPFYKDMIVTDIKRVAEVLRE